MAAGESNIAKQAAASILDALKIAALFNLSYGLGVVLTGQLQGGALVFPKPREDFFPQLKATKVQKSSRGKTKEGNRLPFLSRSLGRNA